MPSPGGKGRRPEPAGRGAELVGRIFGIDARLDGVAAPPDLVLAERQRLAGGDSELPLDQVDPGDRLGDRMLDLQPRIHLDEVEFPGLQPVRSVGDELDGAGAAIARRRAPP